MQRRMQCDSDASGESCRAVRMKSDESDEDARIKSGETDEAARMKSGESCQPVRMKTQSTTSAWSYKYQIYMGSTW